MIKFNFIIILTIFLSFNIYSQNIEFSKENFLGKKKELGDALKNIKEGDKYFDLGYGNYFTAIDYYVKANDFNPNNSELNYKIGRAYLNTNQKFNALGYFEKSFKLDSTAMEDIRYMLAQSNQVNYKFDIAIKYFQQYKIYVKKNVPNNTEIIKEIDKKIKECNSGKELYKKPVNVSIENIGNTVNTKFPDYNPIINADESMMIFTSRRANSTGGKKYPQDGGYYEDIYISYFKDGKWNSPINPGTPLNTDLHDAALGLSPDGQKLLIYVDINGGDIFESILSGDNWTTPISLGDTINTGENHESSATYLYDGKTIFFVSDKPGGIGGRDIYMSKLDKNGKWGIPKNLGRTINTPYDEEGVFMHADGKTLYFSSKGHNSMGGYDIFKSTFVNGKWSEPINLGYPINTPENDVYFSISASGKHAYYSSAKPGGFGGQDIYKISFLEDNKTTDIKKDSLKAVANSLTLLKGTVTDAITGDPLRASIEIIDNVKNIIIATFESNSKTGKYLISLPSGVNYGININSTGYLFHSENFDIPVSSQFQEVTKDIKLNKLEIGSKVILNNIFFDFDKSTLRPESTSELERLIKLMKDIPTLVIEISGHTDNKGSAEYNKKLSESRAISVVNYLVSKGVANNRLKYMGYGFEQPIATNDTDEGRQLNRRTEFKIIQR